MKLYYSIINNSLGYWITLQTKVQAANDPIGPFKTNGQAETWISGYRAGLEDSHMAGGPKIELVEV